MAYGIPLKLLGALWRFFKESWTRNELLSLLDLLLLAYLVYLERQSLLLDKLNHSLYREFFQERTRWYAARGKKKSPTELPVGPEVLLSEETANPQPQAEDAPEAQTPDSPSLPPSLE